MKPHPSIVAHRGYHHKDRNLPGRPLENTLRAFEEAWKMGYTYCECDVNMTTDGEFFIWHDPIWSTDALLDKSSPVIGKPVATCDSDTVFNTVVLLDGSHPCKLVDALECAKRLTQGNDIKQLILELKFYSAQKEICGKFAYLLTKFLFQERPDLLPHVAIIMSFDMDLMRCVAMRYGLNRRSPKLMFLTSHLTFDVTNEHAVKKALAMKDDTGIDGLYLCFEEIMLKRGYIPERNLRELTEEMAIGIWGCPSDQGKIDSLIKKGVGFVNSDLE